MNELRFRQVHLDFHTSGLIPGIGSRFSAEQFQEALKTGHVDSITVFSKCHHGWAYHPSEANEMHPGLDFDLLEAMITAAHAIDVRTPVYLSAGLDEKLARRNPQWLIRNREEQTTWAKDFMTPGYHEFCLNSPYLEVLASQVEEVVRRYDADGIFLDIVGVRKCWCQNCVSAALAEGIDPEKPEAMQPLWERTYARYTARMKEAVHSHRPGLPIFHNNGHISKGRRDLAAMNTHLELESLPTGGWGYDHFPLSARYAQGLGMLYLGMTGKFHTSWGEFGGYKHPNALRYEAALSIANGARCSIGDQLHPEGLMDPATYALIGAAYSEVEAAEPWCVDTASVADVALFSAEAAGSLNRGNANANDKSSSSDAGAVRMLLEGHYLYDVVDQFSDWTRYKVVILPDCVRVTPEIHDKMKAFLAAGGRFLATGASGLGEAGTGFVLDFGARWAEKNPWQPDYFRPEFALKSLENAAFIFYSEGQRLEENGGTVLGWREDPYFNRSTFAFCSHQHTPNSGKRGGPGMTEGPDGIYLAWNVFDDYAKKGSLVLRETVCYALDRLLAERKTVETNLPAQGVVTLQAQPALNRQVLHLLYAAPVRRGNGVEIIEDLLPVRETQVSLRTDRPVASVTLEPQGQPLSWETSETGIRLCVPEFTCHQMVVVQF